MPELETRFAELPDWLKSNNPPAPSWLQRQENTRRNQEEQRRNLALELDRRRTEQDLKKAAFELTVEDQNREMELRGDEALAKIAPAMGNYFQEGDVIGAGNYLLSEASRNPTITRSKQFNQYLNMLGTSFGAKVMQDRMNQMAAQVDAANQSRILSDRENQARMAELQAGFQRQDRPTALQMNVEFIQGLRAKGDTKTADMLEASLFGRPEASSRKALLDSLSRTIDAQLAGIDRKKNLTEQEVLREKDPWLRKKTAIALAFDDGRDIAEAFAGVEMPAPAAEPDAIEQQFNDWDRAIDKFEATQPGAKLKLNKDGTVEDAGWLFGGLTPAEARAAVSGRRATYRSRKGGGAAPEAESRTAPQDPRMGGLPKSTLRFDSTKNLVK